MFKFDDRLTRNIKNNTYDVSEVNAYSVKPIINITIRVINCFAFILDFGSLL